MKEFFRKQLVKLKRRPQTIPLVFIVLSCIVYTFSLTVHSNTVIYCSVSTNSSRMIPLFLFCTTLASILAIFTYTTAYPRNKVKIVMLILVYVMFVGQAVMDVLYIVIVKSRVQDFILAGTKNIPAYIQDSISNVIVHLVMIGLTLISMILMPVYHKLLLKIDTTVENEETKETIKD